MIRKTLTRRTLLTMIAISPMAGCAEIKQYLTPQWVQDVQVIATDVAKFLPAGVSAAVQMWAKSLGDLAARIAAAVQAGGTPSSLLAQFVTALQALAGAGGLTGTWGETIQMAVALLPTILQLAGVVVALAPRGGIHPAFAVAAVTPARARAVLLDLAAR